MRIKPLAAAVVGALVALGVTAPQQARADDYYYDETFEVVAAAASPSAVSVRELGTAPVTITLTTRTREHEQDQSGTVMTLSESMYTPGPADMSVTLKLVGQKGATKHWRGVVNVGGPTRTVRFSGAYNCEFLCTRYLTPIAGPEIHVRGRNSPAITFEKLSAADLGSPTYVVKGRVLSTSKHAYGRRPTVIVGQGDECYNSDQGGTAVRTAPDGRFTAVLNNRITNSMLGAPMRSGQCAKVLSDAKDIRNRRTFLAFASTTVPWTMTLPVQAPKTVKSGSTARVDSAAAPLGPLAKITLERLHGRSAWRPISEGHVRTNGRVSTYIKADALGRHVYRLRSDDSKAISKPFVVTTVR
ncbi:hypothetical protein BJY21_003108 [Kineosphaera limosa]|uniref:Uncharacterized protein n=1 Tax=Kineosphaera limosa NBRC 100340 TaxID=1184609 RepID=K6WAB9_9MICO|nr:hypothetical protein [Kineosphaera limosa]NYE01924.1 hypothetical protein [Kineosphaera limosa]GAB96150.1 hypothetical protein KILIM_032_00350 [Kineosphaera limosa NBRC 100340]